MLHKQEVAAVRRRLTCTLTFSRNVEPLMTMFCFILTGVLDPIEVSVQFNVVRFT